MAEHAEPAVKTKARKPKSKKGVARSVVAYETPAHKIVVRLLPPALAAAEFEAQARAQAPAFALHKLYTYMPGTPARPFGEPVYSLAAVVFASAPDAAQFALQIGLTLFTVPALGDSFHCKVGRSIFGAVYPYEGGAAAAGADTLYLDRFQTLRESGDLPVDLAAVVAELKAVAKASKKGEAKKGKKALGTGPEKGKEALGTGPEKAPKAQSQKKQAQKEKAKKVKVKKEKQSLEKGLEKSLEKSPKKKTKAKGPASGPSTVGTPGTDTPGDGQAPKKKKKPKQKTESQQDLPAKPHAEEAGHVTPETSAKPKKPKKKKKPASVESATQ